MPTRVSRLGPQITINNVRAMRRFGAHLVRFLRPGDVVLLQGALGAGKTTLVQGVARELGISGAVRSPTFLMRKEYDVPRTSKSKIRRLIHIDLYRLRHTRTPNLTLHDLSDPHTLTFIEWGDRVRPRKRTYLRLIITHSDARTRLVFIPPRLLRRVPFLKTGSAPRRE